ncbi:hypothetical protein LAZ67_X001770 [Cordylochernes scorpioides]|uniref:Transposase n=1 Tax=Cordylochernes scorpioides TaxID=51811 RepID=A0ABY6LSS1_9ARAC|nr:hypothetical protein LAZ67_X001770 [Cordylochernes scorpioides]
MRISNKRSAIIELFRQGKRQCEIVRLLKVPQQTVSKAIHRFNEFGHEGDRAGRGRKRTANYIFIKRRLQRYSRAYKLQKVQLITSENKRVRLERCRLLKHRATDEQWERILFTDEKLFTIEQAYNHQKDRIWSAEAPGTSNNSQSIMVWAGICASGKTPSFSWIRGLKSTNKCIAATLSRPPYSRGFKSIWRCGLDVPAGLRVGSQGEIDSRLVQCPFSGLPSLRRNGRPTYPISTRWITACGPFCRPGPGIHAENGTDCRRRTCGP